MEGLQSLVLQWLLLTILSKNICIRLYIKELCDPYSFSSHDIDLEIMGET